MVAVMAPILAVALWLLGSGGSGGVCGRGGCVSTTAAAFTGILIGGFGLLAGIHKMWRATVPAQAKPGRRARLTRHKPCRAEPMLAVETRTEREMPYGSVEEYEQLLRNMGVAESQISARLHDYRGP